MIKLVCTSPFRGYQKGQEVTNPVLVAALLQTHDRHFVKAHHPDHEYPVHPKLSDDDYKK